MQPFFCMIQYIFFLKNIKRRQMGGSNIFIHVIMDWSYSASTCFDLEKTQGLLANICTTEFLRKIFVSCVSKDYVWIPTIQHQSIPFSMMQETKFHLKSCSTEATSPLAKMWTIVHGTSASGSPAGFDSVEI